jgi:hypothetical protein
VFVLPEEVTTPNQYVETGYEVAADCPGGSVW